MLSALQGRSASPTVVNPYTGLQHPRITSRCAHIQAAISSLPLKELHQFFPHLLSNIFGFDRSGGWGLRTFSCTLHSDFPTLLQFLAPGGDLFKLIARLEGERFLYEFPISCLPRPSQQALVEGVVPPFYANKVQLALSVSNTPTHIFLTAFEYYFFHFGYFLVFQQINQSSLTLTPLTPIVDALYTHLLDAYLTHFLPYTGTIPPPLTSSPTQGSPSLLTTPPGSNQSGLFSSVSPGSPGTLGLLKTNGIGTTPVSRHTIQPGMEDVQTETIVQVLVEFWLNQNTYNGGQGDLLAQAQNQFSPNEEHLLLLRRLMKQVHYFTSGSSYSQGTTLTSPLLPLTDTLRSSLVAAFIQKKLYHFLWYSFKHSPLDNTFRYLLELWLTYIQPWRYLDPTKPSAENKESLEALPRKWRAFVLDSFPFFSTLLLEFLGRCFQVDLTTDPAVTLLYRVAKVFAQPGLMEFIEYGESLLLNSDTSPLRSSPMVAACSMKALFIDLCGPLFQYQPICDQETNDAIHSLLLKVHQARVVLTQRTSASHSHPPPVSLPSTPTSPTPPATIAGRKRSWLGSLWGDLVEAFSDSSSQSPSFTTTSTDPRKLSTMLEAIETNLSDMFKLSLHPQLVGGEGSPVLGKAVPLQDTPTVFSDHTHPDTPPSNIIPEYVEGTCHLSPRGKMQLIQGVRKCSNINVQYLGDPLLQPIRSFENATLVRWLYHISCHLNKRYSAQLAAVGSSDSLWSKLLMQLLAPPSPLLLTPPHTDECLPPSTPTSRVSTVIAPTSHEVSPLLHTPRISLRTFGSYYTLGNMSTALIFIWLLSIPVWIILILTVLFVLLYCVFSYHGNRRAHKIK